VTKQIMGAVCEWVHPETGEQFVGSYSELLAQEAE
jgi:hypothetical protein